MTRAFNSSMRRIERDAFANKIAVTVNARSVETVDSLWVIAEFYDVIFRFQQTHERLLGVSEDSLLIRLPRKIFFGKLVVWLKGSEQEWLDTERKEINLIGHTRPRISLRLVCQNIHSRLVPLFEEAIKGI